MDAPHLVMPHPVPAPASREEARGRLVFALDVPSVAEATALVDELDGSVRFFKVGLGLWCRGGRDLAAQLVRRGLDVFVDLKLHDIPHAVASATAALADLGAALTTVHGPPSAIRAAAQVKGATRLLGVTVLTSMDAAEYRASCCLGEERDLAQVVRERAAMLLEPGCDGVVASPLEARALRQAHPGVLLLTPGIRPAGTAADDQKRTATPREAAAAGADWLVVGRPVRDAPDRRAVVDGIVDEMGAGFSERR